MEVMVSIVVITGGILFVMRVYSTAREAINRSGILFENSLLLEDKMYEYEERGVIEEDTDSGHFAGQDNSLWEIEATSLEGEDSNLKDICKVRLSTFKAKGQKYPLFTYLEKKK
jgi:hypothetical protein